MVRIYNYDPKKDGWKAVPSEKVTKTWKIDAGQRGIREHSGPQCHYFLKGKSMCGKFPTEPTDAIFNNTTQAYCDECLPGCRKFAKETKALADAVIAGKITVEEAEKGNVIDYKTAEKLDKPESAKVSH